VTSGAGTFGKGTLFRVQPDGQLSILVNFDGTNGATPYSTLLKTSNGVFYGTTDAGGPYGKGTLFRFTTNLVFSNLAFFDGTNGAKPGFLVQTRDGNLYGTTYMGGVSGGAE
jgi:uncharacterized repeat protein (TIGR03803 family)